MPKLLARAARPWALRLLPPIYDDLIGMIPITRSSWLADGYEAIKKEVTNRLETLPK